MIYKRRVEFQKYLNFSTTIASYLLLQLITALISLLRIPMTINSIGVNNFSLIVIFLSLWPLLTINAEAKRKLAQTNTSNSKPTFLILTKLLKDFFILIVLCSMAGMFLTIQAQFDSKYIIQIVVIFLVGANLHSINCHMRGLLEGDGKIATANLANLAGFVLAFPFFIVAIQTDHFF